MTMTSPTLTKLYISFGTQRRWRWESERDEQRTITGQRDGDGDETERGAEGGLVSAGAAGGGDEHETQARYCIQDEAGEDYNSIGTSEGRVRYAVCVRA